MVFFNVLHKCEHYLLHCELLGCEVLSVASEHALDLIKVWTLNKLRESV